MGSGPTRTREHRARRHGNCSPASPFPNELGYWWSAGRPVPLRGAARHEIADHAAGFDGAWPYLEEIAAAIGEPVTHSRTRWCAATGSAARNWQPSTEPRWPAGCARPSPTSPPGCSTKSTALAHHSFHVFAVYPWVRFLDVDPSTPLRILQACRIRWGVVDSVAEEQVVMTSRPLQLADGALALGEPTAESVRWSRDGTSLAPIPGRVTSSPPTGTGSVAPSTPTTPPTWSGPPLRRAQHGQQRANVAPDAQSKCLSPGQSWAQSPRGCPHR